MRILIIAPTYLPSRRANTIQVMKMAQAIKRLGHEVLVLVPKPKDRRSTAWESLAYHYGLTSLFDVEWITVNAFFRGYDYGVKAISVFRRLNADIMYTRLPQAAALGSVLNIPTIFEIHDIPSGYFGPLILRLFLKGKGARRLVFITQSLRDAINQEFTTLGGYPFTIVAPDGVDLARYESIPHPEKARGSLRERNFIELPDNQFTVGYTGHLYAGRGMDLILEVASHLQNITFLIIGGDPHAVNQVRSKIENLRLNNVISIGFVPNAELPLFQAACEILLMPYQRVVEASSGGNIAQFLSPMKLFEYLACGRVILSSKLPVLEEILNEKNAILLPPDDSRSWIETIQEIRNDPLRWESLAKQARKDSLNFSWESRAKQIFRFD